MNAYRKYFPGTTKQHVMWEMSWINLMMELAHVSDSETTSKNNAEDKEILISPEDEAAEIRKDLGL